MEYELEGKGIIFSPDLIDKEDAFAIIRSCKEYFSALKIGNITLLKYGIGVLKEFKDEFDLPIICDFKIMDIPDIATEIVRLGATNCMDGVMIWGLAGEETIHRCIHEFPNIMVFILTDFTHACHILEDETVKRLAQIAVDYGAYGIQAPATKLAEISELRTIVGNKKIISCGVGYQGTPYGIAVKAGADFEIIGRAIYSSKNPLLEATKAYQAISEVLK